MPSLDQWEHKLKPYFNSSLRILGEIPLTREQIEDIADAVKASIERNKIGKASYLLHTIYPHTFLAFLTGFAAHNTEQAFWIALGNRLGVNRNYLFNHHWHYFYQDEMKQRGLPFFDFEDATNPFVTTIRFHGGIPAYSLPDFFERLLLPTVKRPALNEVPTKQAMDAVKNTVYLVDSPVKNFLENSGKLGEVFFDACRKMARHYLQNQGDLLPAADLGLPEYVVESFGDFMERGEEQQAGHLRRPVLGINPFSELDCVWVKLPEQEVQLRYASGELQWQITWPGRQAPVCHPCTLRRRRQDTLIAEDFFPIEEAVSQVSIALQWQDGQSTEVLRRWTLPLLPPPGRPPLLAFRCADGQQVRAGQALPAELLFLVYPQDGEISPEGTGKKTTQIGEMQGGWKGWQVHEWDLADAWGVQVLHNGQAVGQPVPVAGRQPQPELVGSALAPFDQGEVPLYLGGPPVLKVPVRSGFDPAQELPRWRVEVKSVWNTDPACECNAALSEFYALVALEQDSFLFDLKHVLGENPVGTFHVRLLGPAGFTAEFRFRSWPRLTIIGLPRRILPPEENNSPVSFTVRLASGAKCEVQLGAGDVQLQENIAGWHVTAGPDQTDVNLNLLWQSAMGVIVRVPFRIPIPRLRWALALEHDQGNLEWTSNPLQKSAAAILDSSASALHIQAYGIRDIQRWIRLELVELGQAERVLQEGAFQPTVFSPDWLRIPLSQFYGTLRHDCQQGRFDLVRPPYRDEPGLRIPLLHVPRQMTIQNVRLAQLSEVTWKILWEEEHPLRNRRLMLLPAWQPWQEPWEFKLPDSARGEFLLENVSLPQTRYHVYFYVAPDWEPVRSAPPAGLKPNLWDMVTTLKRLEHIEWEPGSSEEEKFRSLVEKVCIFEEIGDPENRNIALSNCAQHLVHLTNLRLILGLLEWLKSKKIESQFAKFLWRQAYHPTKVEAILQAYRASDPLLQRYLSHVGREAEIYGRSALLIAERVDDPTVIYACLNQLMTHEDELLILLILDMLENARLSNRDAADLLSRKPMWAVEKLAAQESSPHIDRLIASLLPSLGQKNEIPHEQLQQLILRSLPYERDQSVKLGYLLLLVRDGKEEGFRELMQSLLSGTVSEAEAESVLSAVPKHAVKILEQAPNTPEHGRWIEWLAEKFPAVSGVIKPGMKIKTPIGVGQVDYIEDLDRNEMKQALLSSRNARINLLVGEGADRIRVWVNLHNDTISFFEALKAWGCYYCNFAHPDRRAVDRHYNKEHPRAQRVYQEVPASLSMDRDKLELL